MWWCVELGLRGEEYRTILTSAGSNRNLIVDKDEVNVFQLIGNYFYELFLL